MNACLNPFEHHPILAKNGAEQFCSEPHCSYLIEGSAFGQWHIRKLLRSSTMADVYFATSQDASQGAMIVKVVHGCTSDSLTRLEYLGTVQHPHIYPIYSMGESEQKHLIYFLSRYEEAGSLARYTNTGTRFSLNTVFRIIEQAASALQFAHSLHLVHGYIKPENLLIVGRKQIQVSDFYHALQLREILPDPTIYLAPEQLQGQLVPATDQYALAMIACQLFYNFTQSQVDDDIPSQPSFNLQAVEMSLVLLPQSVQRVFRRAFSPEPGARFNKILDFAFELQNSIGLPGYRSLPAFPNMPLPISMPGYAPTPTPKPSSQSRSSLIPQQTVYPTKALPLCKLPGHTAPVSLVHWTSDGTHLASASLDKSIRIWHVHQKIGTPQATLIIEEGTITALGWSPGSSYLAAATEQASIRLWKITQATKLTPQPFTSWWGHDGPITTLSWSSDDKILASGGKDRTIRKWDLRGKLLSSWLAHGRGGVTALAWSPAGDMLASGGSDRLITLWDAENNTQVGGYSAHSDEIRKLCWSPDGRLLSSYAGKKDLAVHLWNPYTHQKIATLTGHTREVIGIFWSADSRWLVTASADRTLRCWDLNSSPVELFGQPIALDEEPLTMEGVPGKNCIVLGTTSMCIVVLQLT